MKGNMVPLPLAYGLLSPENSFSPKDLLTLGQIWHNGVIVIVDIITISIDVPIIVDFRGIICIVARRA